MLWELQRGFYCTRGPKAWQDSESSNESSQSENKETQNSASGSNSSVDMLVPFDITSNPYLAQQWARTIIASLLDLLYNGLVRYLYFC